MYVHIYIWREKDTERYFKELAHTVVGAGKSEMHRAAQQARNSGESTLLSGV